MAKEKDEKTGKEGEQSQEPKAAVVEDDGLVEVTKGKETLRVHPTCVKAHVAAGWSE